LLVKVRTHFLWAIRSGSGTGSGCDLSQFENSVRDPDKNHNNTSNTLHFENNKNSYYSYFYSVRNESCQRLFSFSKMVNWRRDQSLYLLLCSTRTNKEQLGLEKSLLWALFCIWISLGNVYTVLSLANMVPTIDKDSARGPFHILLLFLAVRFWQRSIPNCVSIFFC
jgi:hypothetical protein